MSQLYNVAPGDLIEWVYENDSRPVVSALYSSLMNQFVLVNMLSFRGQADLLISVDAEKYCWLSFYGVFWATFSDSCNGSGSLTKRNKIKIRKFTA